MKKRLLAREQSRAIKLGSQTTGDDPDGSMLFISRYSSLRFLWSVFFLFLLFLLLIWFVTRDMQAIESSVNA